MRVQGNPNSLYVEPAMAYGGTRQLGFLPSIWYGASVASMMYNQLGFEEEFQDVENENRAKALEAGFDVPALDMVFAGQEARRITTGYEALKPITEFQRAAYAADMWQSVSDDESRTKTLLDQRVAKLKGDRDKMYAAAKAARPDLGILSMDEMRQEVVKRGRELYRRYYEARPTWANTIGGFLGESLGSFDPRTNRFWPAGFVGGFGKTAGMRVMTQMGAGGVTQAVDIATGSAENMQWFGLDPTTGQLALQIAAGTVLPGAVAGAGELIRFGARKVAARGQKPPVTPGAPPSAIPPPGVPTPRRTPPPRMATGSEMVLAGYTPQVRPRVAKDLDFTAMQIGETGTTVFDIVPPSTKMEAGASVAPRITPYGLGGSTLDGMRVELPPTWQRAARGHSLRTVDTAREMDPEVFTQLDKLDKDIAETRRQLARAQALTEERTGRPKATNKATDEAIAELEKKALRARTPEGRAAVLQEIEALRDVAARKPGAQMPKGYEVDKYAEKLARQLTRQQELFGLAERAVERAQGRWELDVAETQALRDELLANAMRPVQPKAAKPRKGAKPKPTTLEQVEAGFVPRTERPVDRFFRERGYSFPETQDPRAVGGKVDEPTIDTVTRVTEARVKEADDINEGVVTAITRMIDEHEATSITAPKTRAEAGPSEPIPTLPDGTPLSEVLNVEIALDDGTVMSFRDFLKQQIAEDAQSIAEATSCAVAQGWSRGA